MVQTQHTNAYETTLRLDYGPTALTAEVQSTDGSPASPCYLVIEPTNADRREYVLFDGTFTADQFVTSSTANRYLMPGSAATSGITHPAGSIVRFAPVAQHFTDHHSDAAPHLATSAATGNRLVLRDANGRFQAVSPSVDADVAVKSYVDTHAKTTQGTLGYAQVTADQSGIIGAVDLTGLSVTADVLANRRIRVSFFCYGWSGTDVGDVFDVRVERGDGTRLQLARVGIHTAPQTVRGDAVSMSAVIVEAAGGSKTYKMAASRVTGTGSGKMQAAGGAPAFILVEDIGPV